MAYYKPCTNCAADKYSCARRAEIANGISGLSVTVVNFICKERRSLFHSGQRVKFDWTYWEYLEETDREYGMGLIYHGTVIEENGLRFIVRVDDGPSACDNKVEAKETFKSDNLVIKVKPSAMTALNEPDRPLCAVCSGYEGEDARCQGWGRIGAIDSYWPQHCMVLKSGVKHETAQAE